MAKGIYIGELSERYTEVEYLQSSGTQYIDTGYKPGGNTRVVCEFSRIARSGSGIAAALFGARKAKNNYDYTFWGYNYQDEVNLADNYYSTNKTITVPTTERILVDKNKNVTTINNNSSVTYTFSNFVSSYNMYIFTTNKAGSPDTAQMGSIRIYYLKIYDNGVLVRDFVPAISLKGVYGFFDKVNNQFYTNKGSGTFVVGNNTGNVLYENTAAQKVRKIYVGINNVARKIKKAYIGIGGIARPCFSKGELIYYGKITELTSARSRAIGATVNNYGLFAGGEHNGVGIASTECYNSSLSRMSQLSFPKSRSQFIGCSFGNYAIFGGGMMSSRTSIVDGYNSSLERVTLTSLSASVDRLSCAATSQLAIFGGGTSNGSSSSNKVNAYNSSLSRSVPSTLLTSDKLDAAAAGNTEYVLFGGGGSVEVECYNNSLTKSFVSQLNQARVNLASGSLNNYMLFAGGRNSSFTSYNLVEAYDFNLTKSVLSPLTKARYLVKASSSENYIVFGCGVTTRGYTPTASTDAYNDQMTKVLVTVLEKTQAHYATTNIGNYILFAGGVNTSTVEVYTE